MNNNAISQVHIAIQAGLNLLHDNFDNYHWPVIKTKDKTDHCRIHEANLSFHAGMALSQREYVCFPEFPFRDKNGTVKRIDLLAIAKDITTAVTIEAKSELTYIGPNQLLEDHNRLLNFTPQNDYSSFYYDHDKLKNLIGIQLCYCWDDDLAEWWNSGHKKNLLPPRRRGNAWEAWGHKLRKAYANPIKELTHWKEDDKARWNKFYGLGTIFEIND